MSNHYPRIRYFVDDELLLFREGVSINFYLLRAHQEIAPAILRSLDAYLRAIGPGCIGYYIDEHGYDQKLDARSWNLIREDCLSSTLTLVRLRDALDCQHRYCFEYHGHQAYGDVEARGLPVGSAVSFWLPTEYLEEHGPERVRDLALELARLLPFCSGHAGLSFNGETSPLTRSEETQALCFRYPGVDCTSLARLSRPEGPQVRGAAWLTFLGPPLLGEMGGAEALRTRLTSPDTRVEELDGERVVISLGRAPEAGDTEQGQTLPAYRELARVLEPWLYHDELASKSEPEVLRWERRFLD